MMQVKELMTTDVETITPDTNLIEVAKLMRDGDVGAVPVGEDDRLIGMITDRDIVVRGIAEGVELSSTEARDVMSDKILYCFDDQDIEHASQLMSENQIRRLPVLNRNKRLIGIVALGDIAQTDQNDTAASTLQKVSQPHPSQPQAH